VGCGLPRAPSFDGRKAMGRRLPLFLCVIGGDVVGGRGIGWDVK
jgi:hypothetical protein